MEQKQRTKIVKNGFVYYTQFQKKTLKNGDIKIYKKTAAHKLKCVNLKEKNQILNKMKIKITHNPDFTTDDIKTLFNIINFDPKQIKNLLNNPLNKARFSPCNAF